MKINFTLAFILCATMAFLAVDSYGQIQTIRGTVTDQVSGEAIPFAHLRITGTAYGTSTNLDGQFEIKLDLQVMERAQRTLTLSCIGYESQQIQPTDIQPSNAFRLKATTTNLEGVTVTGKKPRKKLINQGRRLVQRAFRRIPLNYHSETVLYPSFYRHYCAENETYVRLIEAAMDVYRSGKQPYQALYPDENLEYQVNQLRRSFDFTESARLSHPPISLNFLLTNDLTAYEYNNPFFDKRPVNYAIRDTTLLDDQQIVIVDFSADSDPAHPRSFDGALYVGLDDIAFIKAEVNERLSRKTVSDSMNVVIRKTTFFKKQAKTYYIDRTISDLEALHMAFDSLGAVSDSVVHRAHIELITNDVVLKPEVAIKGDEPTKEDLRYIAYDSLFWEKYTILEATDLEKQIIQDLSARLSLEQQFAMFNDIDLGGKSVIASDEFQEAIKPYEGVPTYVILWSSWAYPNYFDIEPSPYLARRLKKGKANLLLLSLDSDEEEWQMSKMVYQLNRKGIIHDRMRFEFDSDIARKYFKNVLPYRCLIDANGELVSGTPPLPSDPDIQEFLDPILTTRNVAGIDKPSPPVPQNQN